MGLIYTKIWEIRAILTKGLVNVKMSVKMVCVYVKVLKLITEVLIKF